MTLQECNNFLRDAYNTHKYVSTPMLQVEAGLSYVDALFAIRYAEDRGWLTEREEGEVSFKGTFKEPAFEQATLSRVKILYIARKITDAQLDFLTRHADPLSTFTAKDASNEEMCYYLDFLLKEKLIVQFGTEYCIGIDRETLEKIKAQKIS